MRFGLRLKFRDPNIQTCKLRRKMLNQISNLVYRINKPRVQLLLDALKVGVKLQLKVFFKQVLIGSLLYFSHLSVDPTHPVALEL